MKKVLRKAVLMMMAIAMMLGMLPTISSHADEYNSTQVAVVPGVSLDGMRFSVQKDSILVSADCRNLNMWKDWQIKFCMYAYDHQTAQWKLVGGWQDSDTFVWEPDANDIYTVVIYVGYVSIQTGNVLEIDSCWREVSRPQMGIQVTGDCAVPTSEGLLYGCTSNINPNSVGDENYFTTCYIWSHDRQAWIAQASYRAWGSAWYRTAMLPKGTYMMYNCTEKLMPDGSKRKLSCHYYLFSLT